MTRRIVQTWKNEDLSNADPLFSISQNSWKSHNPQWKYDFFTDETIDLYVKARLPNYHRQIFSKYQGQIERVDAFRIVTMFFDAGLYCDLDGECLKPIETVILNPGISLGQLSNEESKNKYSNAWIFSSGRREQFWMYVLADSIRRFYSNRGYHSTEYLTGPILLTDCVDNYLASSMSEINSHIKKWALDPIPSFKSKSQITLLPPLVIYPIDWTTIDDKLCKEIIARRIKLGKLPSILHDSSHCIHYWSHSWSPPQYSLRKRLALRVKYLYRVYILRLNLKAPEFN